MSNEIVPYYDGMDKIIEHANNPDVFKISPSSIHDFFVDTAKYYREQVEGNEKSFQGNTSTYLGTLVHHHAEMAYLGRSVDEDDIHNFLADITDTSIDKDKILSLYQSMASTLIQNTVHNDTWDIQNVEQFNFVKLNNDVYIGGTYDCLRIDPANPDGFRVVDYKTASTKPQGITQKYRLQAYAYAWMLTKLGKNITSIELCFVVQPTKTLPVRYFNFAEPYTSENHKYIDNILKLIADSVSLYKQSDTHLRRIIAQDAELTNKPKITAFPL